MVATALLLITALIYSGPSLWAWAEHLFERNVAAPALLVAGSVTDPILPPDAGPTDTRVGVSKAESIAPVALVPVLPSSSPAESQVPLVVVKAKGLTWIAVSDANGVTLLRKTLSAGQSASASGALPLWVVVGKADNAEVSVRGEAVTLQPSVPDNVARFKVQ
jgi:cytoskeleton protein RodZ